MTACVSVFDNYQLQRSVAELRKKWCCLQHYNKFATKVAIFQVVTLHSLAEVHQQWDNVTGSSETPLHFYQIA